MRTKHVKANKANVDGDKQVALARHLHALTNTIVSRAQLAQQLGNSFAGDRELYDQAGYPKILDFDRLQGRYVRQDIAKRIVNAFPDATWRDNPEVFETDDEKETTFEKAWKELEKSINMYHYFHRADRIAGIGAYSVLLLGFDDVTKEENSLEKPVSGAKELLYIQPYNQNHAKIDKFVDDPTDKRFGLPEIYQLSNADTSGDTTVISRTGSSSSTTKTDTGTRKVHWTRVIHIAEGLSEDDVFGTPRLEAVYNRLQDLETVVAGASEMFWKCGFPGYAIKIDEDAKLGDQSESELEDEIEEYFHSLSRYIRLQGMSIEELKQQIADPKNHAEILINLIAGTVNIPSRILMGSERGELASTQDESNWLARVDERRTVFAEPIILRAFIDRLIEVGVLPEPGEDGYQVKWPDLQSLSEKDQAEVAKMRTEYLAMYVKSGADALIPPFQFLTLVAGFSKEEAEAMISEVLQALEDEAADAEAAAAAEEELKEQLRQELELERQQAGGGPPPPPEPKGDEE